MIIVIGRKLRKLLPDGVFDTTSDPLARDKSYTWGSNIGGVVTWHIAPDPDKMIWCAEVTTAGRGKGKKQGIVLMSANCGFATIAPLPTAPELISQAELEKLDYFTRREAEEENKQLLTEYRSQLETAFLDAIRRGMIAFSLPENRVLDYTDTVRRIELVKGRTSTPGIRLEELIERELQWKDGADPLKRFNVRGNWTSRKFGNGDYRHVERAVFAMLGMNGEEQQTWLDRFLKPLKEKMTD